MQPGFQDSDKSWSVNLADLDQESLDLSVKNPNQAEEIPLREPEEILAEIAALDAESARVLSGVQGLL